jgi:hypothetical protein
MERRRIGLEKIFLKGDDRNLLNFGDNSGILQINLETPILFAENLKNIIIVGQSADENSKLIERISNYRSLKTVFRGKEGVEIITDGGHIEKKKKRKKEKKKVESGIRIE